MMSSFLPPPRRTPDSPVPQTVNSGDRAMVQELEARVARQNLIIQTLCRILMEKGVVTDQEWNEWLTYMDGLDGRVDGKLTEPRGPRQCEKCMRMSSPKATACQYCGADFQTDLLHPDPNRG